MPNAYFRPLEGPTALLGCGQAVIRGVSPKVSLATYKALNRLHTVLKSRLFDHILEFILFLTFIKDAVSFYIKLQTQLNETHVFYFQLFVQGVSIQTNNIQKTK